MEKEHKPISMMIALTARSFKVLGATVRYYIFGEYADAIS